MIYIQAGKLGDKLRDNMSAPKILVEVPHTGFEVEWDKIYRKVQVDRFKKLGIKKRDMNGVIESFNKEWESAINKHLK